MSWIQNGLEFTSFFPSFRLEFQTHDSCVFLRLLFVIRNNNLFNLIYSLPFLDSPLRVIFLAKKFFLRTRRGREREGGRQKEFPLTLPCSELAMQKKELVLTLALIFFLPSNFFTFENFFFCFSPFFEFGEWE